VINVNRATTLVVALAMALALGACAPTGATTGTPTSGQLPNLVPGPDVTVSAAAELNDEGAFVLDVREPDEFAGGHIAGATLIPLGQLAARVDEVPRDRAVVVVCRTGHRSAQGRDVLLSAGFTAVTSMTGGMTEWIAAGHPVVTGS
jgi:rhodanese-related sulfurtransferase